MSLRLVVLSGIMVVAVLRYISARRYRARLPPGPTQLPLIGNLYNFPMVQTWKTFAEWGHVWGDVISISIMGQTMIVLNSGQAMSDFLEKKGSINAEPATMMFSCVLAKFNRLLVFSSYQRSTPMRRLMHGAIGSRALVTKLYPVDEKWMSRFLKRVLHSPEDLTAHIQWMRGAIILDATYGYEVKEKHDPFVDVVNRAMACCISSTKPGKYLVDTFRFLRYIPGWVPGFGFQREAVQYSQTLTDMAELPFRYVKDQMISGCAKSSFVSDLLEEECAESTPEKEDLIKWAAASIYAGGTDSTVAAVSSFFLIMSLFPTMQKKAQDELDSVVGDRLPNQNDLPNLPYLYALIGELYRWNPIIPISIHAAREDDTQRGYLIPKGSLIVPNLWAILHDPQVYDDPMTFNPERYIAKPGREPDTDPRKFAFGMGRRSCPGTYLAEASISITCAMSLAVFNITEAVDENRVAIEAAAAYTDETITRPKPFKCTIEPRSARAKDLILSL